MSKKKEQGMKTHTVKASLLADKYVFLEQFGDKKTGAYWHIKIKIGVQSFRIDYLPEKIEEAKWMKQQIGTALAKLVLDESITKN